MTAALLQPAVKQPPRQGCRQTAPTVEIEAITGLQGREGQVLEASLARLQILEHLGESGQSGFGARSDGLQQRQNLEAQTIAAEAPVLVRRIRPDRQGQLTAAVQGLAALQPQQRPHQDQPGGQGAAGPQAAQPP